MTKKQRKEGWVDAGPRLFVGTFSNNVYFAPKTIVKDNGDGTGMFEVVGNKIDVSETFHEVAERLGYTKPTKPEAAHE